LSTSPLELDPYVLPLVWGREILDLGCGYGHWGHLLQTHYSQEEAVRVTGVDAFQGNTRFCQQAGTYSEVVCDDVIEYLRHCPSKNFDTIIAVELIEHLSKDRGHSLMREIDRVARKVAVLSTPNFPCLRPGSETMVGFNEWEHHLSQWSVQELSKYGYTVWGVGHKLHSTRIRGLYRALTTFPTIDAICRAWAEQHPRWSRNLLAAKSLDGNKISVKYGCN
jgi:SAM-dependent methyltransferase